MLTETPASVSAGDLEEYAGGISGCSNTLGAMSWWIVWKKKKKSVEEEVVGSNK